MSVAKGKRETTSKVVWKLILGFPEHKACRLLTPWQQEPERFKHNRQRLPTRIISSIGRPGPLRLQVFSVTH
jgi:hypothetical protein